MHAGECNGYHGPRPTPATWTPAIMACPAACTTARSSSPGSQGSSESPPNPSPAGSRPGSLGTPCSITPQMSCSVTVPSPFSLHRVCHAAKVGSWPAGAAGGRSAAAVDA